MEALRLRVFLDEEVGAPSSIPPLLLQNHCLASYMGPPSQVLTRNLGVPF